MSHHCQSRRHGRVRNMTNNRLYDRLANLCLLVSGREVRVVDAAMEEPEAAVNTGLGTTARPDMVLVPRVPTKAMVEAAWAEALAEDAAGVWQVMIEACK